MGVWLRVGSAETSHPDPLCISTARIALLRATWWIRSGATASNRNCFIFYPQSIAVIFLWSCWTWPVAMEPLLA